MEKIEEILYKYLNEMLVRLIISNPRTRTETVKISLRPVLIRKKLVFQASIQQEKQVFHKNLSVQEAVEEILKWMKNFRQMQIFSTSGQASVLVSKKGTVTMKEKKTSSCVKKQDLSHNRKKRYILDPEQKVDFLVDLGVQTGEGKIVHAKYDKFRQINRFLEFIEDILPELPRDREITILDFGCGKSYLTFAMYHYLKKLKGYQVHIIGLDLKEDVIARCRMLAASYGYEGLDFFVGDIAGYQGVQQVDMVVTLHACDTATDYALDKAIRWGANVILSVPCCQHELNGQMKNELLGPVWKYGLIKERMAALFTDALRAGILESKGYQVQILEFIDMEHTPKNILIRGIKRGTETGSQDYRRIMEFLQVNPTLAALQEGTGEGTGGSFAEPLAQKDTEDREEGDRAECVKA
ncbi:MAG: SAM-dependent methyltransferase [Lachnospiraceae bacterium]|nr:SAM-dependent methyltransferase [Lachnospiraceae bacterium]